MTHVTPIAYDLNRLNALRTLNGMKPLKAWKESRAKLDAAIDKLNSNIVGTDTRIDAPVTVEQHVPHNGMKIEFKSSSGKTVAKPHIVKSKPAGDAITLVEIAHEMKLNPKVARAKLRRLKLPADIILGKHLFKRAAKDVVIAALKTDHRKK